MNNTLRFLPLVLILLVSLSCKNQKSTPEETPPSSNDSTKPLSFTTETKKWADGDCDKGDHACLTIELNYPLAKDGKIGVAEKINDHIRDYLIVSLEMEDSEEDITSLDQAAQRYIKSFQEEKESMGDMAHRWAIEIDGKHATYKNILVIRLLSYTNTGGAHPNVYQSFTNFDIDSGEELYYEDFVIDSLALLKIAEERFYTSRNEMDGGIEKDDAFWGKPFYLPENFAVTNKGVKFFYNNYEVLAYVFGPTEFTISYADLKGIMRLDKDSK